MADTEIKCVDKATYGWNKEKKCVEIKIVINEEVYVIPAYKGDLKSMMTRYELEEMKD